MPKLTDIPQVPEQSLPRSGLLSNRKGKCLLLAFRHLGDAVITCGFLGALGKANPEMSIDILGRPELEEVFTAGADFRRFWPINLPIYGHHRRTLQSITSAIRTWMEVRREHYDFCINLIGDVREAAIGKMTGARWNIGPAWPRGHLFKQKMTDRGARSLTNCSIPIPTQFSNFYDALQYFASTLGLGPIDWERLQQRQMGNDRSKSKIEIFLHPGASHPSRRWPISKWKQLVGRLRRKGWTVTLVGAPSEGEALRQQFAEELSDACVMIVTPDLPGLFRALSGADLLIGMDSLSAHAAHAVGIPSVVLNGSSDPGTMTPPGGIPLSAGSLCRVFPCNYQYPCVGTESEFICCRGIEVESVLQAAEAALDQNQRAQSRI